MARPKVDRVARNVRLPQFLDARLVKAAAKQELSVNQAIEAAVSDWVANPSRSFAETFEATVTVPISAPAVENDRKDIVIAADGPGTPTKIIRECRHPKELLNRLSWGTLCGQCGARVR